MPNVTYRMFVDKMGGTDVSSFIGVQGEIFYDPNDGALRVSDGVTPGGAAVPVTNAAITIVDGGIF